MINKILFDLTNKFFVFPYIFLFIIFNNLSLLKSYSSEIEIDRKLSVEFLDQLPTNDYIVGPGDTLNVVVSRDLEISDKVTIDGEGTINLPRLERVYVSGLTINELNLLLNKAYLKFIKFPNVETFVSSYRPVRVFVNGEVVNPGLQTLSGSLSLSRDKGSENIDLFQTNNNKSTSINNFGGTNYYFPTVFDAIRASGGITKYTDLRNIQIIRKDTISNGSGKKTTTLNFEKVLISGDNSQNLRIYDSDIIILKKASEPNTNILAKAILSNLNPRFINVFVSGRVNRPGEQTVSRASVLSDAIDMAGGAKVLRGPVTFIRFNSDGTIDKRKIRLTQSRRGQFNNPNLRDGDLILVGNNILTSANEVISEVTTPFTGIFSTYALIKAISDWLNGKKFKF